MQVFTKAANISMSEKNREKLDAPKQVIFLKIKLFLLKACEGKLKHFHDYLGDLDN